MTHIIFYEKPGCINNTKQKKLLREAGHDVDYRDLLKQDWTRETLLQFFADMRVSDWFNRSAPDVQSGKVDPDTVEAEQALTLMIENPLLIRRPLMQAGNHYRVGFDLGEVEQWIGLGNKGPVDTDMESCPQKRGHKCDTE